MDTLQEIEVSLKAAKETVKLGEALLRLEKNRDFNKLIGERYFQQEASRLVGLLADPEIVGTPARFTAESNTFPTTFFKNYWVAFLYF